MPSSFSRFLTDDELKRVRELYVESLKAEPTDPPPVAVVASAGPAVVAAPAPSALASSVSPAARNSESSLAAAQPASSGDDSST